MCEWRIWIHGTLGRRCMYESSILKIVLTRQRWRCQIMPSIVAFSKIDRSMFLSSPAFHFDSNVHSLIQFHIGDFIWMFAGTKLPMVLFHRHHLHLPLSHMLGLYCLNQSYCWLQPSSSHNSSRLDRRVWWQGRGLLPTPFKQSHNMLSLEYLGFLSCKQINYQYDIVASSGPLHGFHVIILLA